MSRVLSETRERFLLSIAETLPVERLIEVYFFAPIRQGGIESGVAVIAAHVERPPDAPVLADAPPPADAPDTLGFDPPAPAERYTVYTAKYRLVLKGPDRGKWESSLVAEADAPLVTVATVVRGVQRRSGDADEIERMSGDEARAAIRSTAIS